MKSRHLLLIPFLLIFASCTTMTGSQSGRLKFESVYRAAKSIQGAISVGLTHQQMGELLQKFATEILIAKDKAESGKEQSLVADYEEALAILKDSQTLWKVKICNAESGHTWEDIPIEGEVGAIADKYQLKKDHKGWENGEISGTSVQVLWEKAGVKLQEGDKNYNAMTD